MTTIDSIDCLSLTLAIKTLIVKLNKLKVEFSENSNFYLGMLYNVTILISQPVKQISAETDHQKNKIAIFKFQWIMKEM